MSILVIFLSFGIKSQDLHLFRFTASILIGLSTKVMLIFFFFLDEIGVTSGTHGMVDST